MEKSAIIQECIARTQARIQEIHRGMEQAQEAIQDDTKSSAGDKYETTREMVQQDLNRYQKQLLEATKDLNILLDIGQQRNTLGGLGARIETNIFTCMLATSIGLLQLEAYKLYVISPASPLGKLFVGTKVGDSISFNGQQHTILGID